jgi:hypothetical protein
MASMTNPSKKTVLAVCATGCEPATVRVVQWANLPGEVQPGEACDVRIDRLVALRFEKADNALEAVALQLEAMANQIRKLKAGS